MTYAIVVMGASGSGKTTVGSLLAKRLEIEFAEGDNFHPQSNIDKMASGTPLTDEDRKVWLAALAAFIHSERDQRKHCVVACSALKVSYRNELRAADPHAFFVMLDTSQRVLHERVAMRTDHFMPASLVASQVNTLEPLRPEENGIIIDATKTPEGIVEIVLDHLQI